VIALAALAALLWGSIAAPLGYAQPAPDAAIGRAKDLYKSAEAAMKDGRYDDATRDYGAAYELSKDPALFFKIARANERAGKCDVAVIYYARYLREGKPSEQFVAATKERIAACGGDARGHDGSAAPVEPHPRTLGAGEQGSGGTTPGRAGSDSTAPGSAASGGATPGPAGSGRAAPGSTGASAPGSTSSTSVPGSTSSTGVPGSTSSASARGSTGSGSTNVAAGTSSGSADVAAGTSSGSADVAAGTGNSAPAPVLTPSNPGKVAWLLGGGAIALVTLGGVLAYASSSSENDVRDLYVGFAGQPATFDAQIQKRYDELVDQGHRYQHLSWAAFGLAGAAAAGAAVLFVLGRRDEPAPHARVTPLVTTSTAGVAVTF
jgi:hypothetical protein